MNDKVRNLIRGATMMDETNASDISYMSRLELSPGTDQGLRVSETCNHSCICCTKIAFLFNWPDAVSSSGPGTPRPENSDFSQLNQAETETRPQIRVPPEKASDSIELACYESGLLDNSTDLEGETAVNKVRPNLLKSRAKETGSSKIIKNLFNASPNISEALQNNKVNQTGSKSLDTSNNKRPPKRKKKRVLYTVPTPKKKTAGGTTKSSRKAKQDGGKKKLDETDKSEILEPSTSAKNTSNLSVESPKENQENADSLDVSSSEQPTLRKGKKRRSLSTSPVPRKRAAKQTASVPKPRELDKSNSEGNKARPNSAKHMAEETPPSKNAKNLFKESRNISEALQNDNENQTRTKRLDTSNNKQLSVKNRKKKRVLYTVPTPKKKTAGGTTNSSRKAKQDGGKKKLDETDKSEILEPSTSAKNTNNLSVENPRKNQANNENLEEVAVKKPGPSRRKAAGKGAKAKTGVKKGGSSAERFVSPRPLQVMANIHNKLFKISMDTQSNHVRKRIAKKLARRAGSSLHDSILAEPINATPVKQKLYSEEAWRNSSLFHSMCQESD